MSQWYYADRSRNRQGPVDAAELAQLFREGRVDLQTLAWRDGLDNWKSLADVADELGLLNDAPSASVADTLSADSRLSLEPMDGDNAAAVVSDSNGTPIAATATPVTGTDSDGRAVFGSAEPSYTAESPYTVGTPIQREPVAEGASPYAAPRASLNQGAAVYGGGHIVHAGFLKRFAASIIDSFVTGILSYAVLIPLMLVFGFSMGALTDPGAMAGGAGLMLNLLTYPITIGIPALYFGWMQSSSSYASLGKMAVGIKVVRTNGEGASFWRNFLRYIAYVMFGTVTCGIGFIISAFMVGLSERKQAVHDMICDTLVVDKWAFTAHPERQSEALGTVTIVILALGALLILGGIALMVFAIGMAASMGR